MRSIKTLHKRMEKLETAFLFNTGKLFYETLSSEDLTKLLRCVTNEELKYLQGDFPDKLEFNELIENYYNKYKDSMNSVFANDQELREAVAEIDFYVKYHDSLNKTDQLKLKDYNSKVSKRFEELLIIRRKKSRLFNELQFPN